MKKDNDFLIKKYKEKYLNYQIISYRLLIILISLITIGFVLFFALYSVYVSSTTNNKNNILFLFLIFSIVFLILSFLTPFIIWIAIKYKQKNMTLLSKNWKMQINSFVYSYVFKYDLWKKNGLLKIINSQDKRVMK